MQGCKDKIILLFNVYWYIVAAIAALVLICEVCSRSTPSTVTTLTSCLCALRHCHSPSFNYHPLYSTRTIYFNPCVYPSATV